MPQEFSRLARLFTALAAFTVLAACGGNGNGNGDTPPPFVGGTVTVSGRITFDRLDFSTTAGAGLNPNNPIESPAREVVVEAVRMGTFGLAMTSTDANGDYTLTVPANTDMIIRARAQMTKTGTAPTWMFAVRDNTAGDGIYALDSALFNSGTTNVTAKNLRAPSDWNGNGYNPGRRAAPFAIIDTVYEAKQLILGANPTAQFPPLNLFWSEDNKNAEPFCPSIGNIGTSFYFRDATGQTTDECATNPRPLTDGIYILGFFPTSDVGDTDEYDSHVIAHEFGHYFEDRFSRSDSIGGEHNPGDRLDLRVAFGEGWGNAFGSMALNDPQYRDSFDGITQDFGFNLESDRNDNEGWFSEASVGEVLWDVFDSVADPGDNVALGFTPIYTVMTGDQVNTDALTSIYSFASSLRAQNASSAGAIASLLNDENIESTPDAFGAGETNNGGDPRALPVYADILLNQQIPGVCSSSVAGSKDPIINPNSNPNKLGNHRFFRFVNDAARPVAVTALGAQAGLGTVAATDPDIFVFRRGEAVLAGESTEVGREAIPAQQPLPAGTYIIDVFDFQTTGTNQPPRCMTLSITG